jgi:hypothetical protein
MFYEYNYEICKNRKCAVTKDTLLDIKTILGDMRQALGPIITYDDYTGEMHFCGGATDVDTCRQPELCVTIRRLWTNELT